MKSLLKQILHAGMELIRDSSKLIRLRIQMHQRQIKEIEIWQRKQRYRVYAETLGRLLAECFRGKSYFVLLKPVTNPDDVRINFQQPVTRKNGITFFCYRMQKTSKEPIESYRYNKLIADMNYDINRYFSSPEFYYAPKYDCAALDVVKKGFCVMFCDDDGYELRIYVGVHNLWL